VTPLQHPHQVQRRTTAIAQRRRRRTSFTWRAPAPQQVQGLQNSLAAVNEAPGLGLSEAAELLRAELRVDLVR
jgi:hypothetical protein